MLPGWELADTSKFKLGPDPKQEHWEPCQVKRPQTPPCDALINQPKSTGAPPYSIFLRDHTQRPWCAAGAETSEFHVTGTGTCSHAQRHRKRSSQGPAEKMEHREPCYEYVKPPQVPPCDALTDSTYQQAHHGVPAFYELTHHVHGVRPVYRRASSTMLPGMGTCRHVKVQARSGPKARTLGTMPGQMPANAALRCSHKPAKINRRATLFHLPTRSHTASMVRGWYTGGRVQP